MVKVATIIGGLSKLKQDRMLRSNPHFVVATPGRLYEYVRDEPTGPISTLKNLAFLTIDEADRMVEHGHFRELDKILGFIQTDEVEIVEDNFRQLIAMDAAKKKEIKDKASHEEKVKTEALDEAEAWEGKDPKLANVGKEDKEGKEGKEAIVEEVDSATDDYIVIDGKRIKL